MNGFLTKTQLTLLCLLLLSPGFNSLHQTPIIVNSGQNLTLLCHLNVRVDCTWQRDNKGIKMTGRYSFLNITNDMQKTIKDCSILITNVMKMDAAEWVCTSKANESIEGNKEAMYKVTVTDFTITTTETAKPTITTTIVPLTWASTVQPVQPLPTILMPSSVTLQTSSSIALSTLESPTMTPATATKQEELPVAVLVSSATSGGLFALVFLIGAAIFACYRSRKSKQHPHVMSLPMHSYGQVAVDGQFNNSIHMRHSLARDLTTPTHSDDLSSDPYQGYLIPNNPRIHSARDIAKRSSRTDDQSEHYYEDIIIIENDEND